MQPGSLVEQSFCNGLVWGLCGGIFEATHSQKFTGIFTVTSFCAGMFSQVTENCMDEVFTNKLRVISPLLATASNASAVVTLGSLLTHTPITSKQAIVYPYLFSLALSAVKGLASKPLYPDIFKYIPCLKPASSQDPFDVKED